MYNEELFNKLAEEFEPRYMMLYCLMTSKMYDLLYKDCKDPQCNELDYDRQWWLDKHNELKEQTILNR